MFLKTKPFIKHFGGFGEKAYIQGVNLMKEHLKQYLLDMMRTGNKEVISRDKICSSWNDKVSVLHPTKKEWMVPGGFLFLPSIAMKGNIDSAEQAKTTDEMNEKNENFP
ncbi:hypothetical protein JTB14_032442 [Gonioctena quinquepunctata]|nr:hypothetical protein JTB14_032442 [Gonioctena quinquepunctata]